MATRNTGPRIPTPCRALPRAAPRGTFGGCSGSQSSPPASHSPPLAPAAAWTPLAGGVQNTDRRVADRHAGGHGARGLRLAAAGTISVSRAHAAPKTVVSGDPIAGRSQLVQQPNGAIQLYFPNAQGVGRLTSTDDGVTWTGPIQTQSHTTGPVESATRPGRRHAALLPGRNRLRERLPRPERRDGEERLHTLLRLQRVARRRQRRARAAGVLLQRGSRRSDGRTSRSGRISRPAAPTPLKPVDRHEAPLVADHLGNTFLAWAPGYPSATGISVVPFRSGSPAGDGVTFRGPFSGGDPHMALSVDAQDRLWAVWTQGGVLHAARSRSHGMHFGATVSVPLPGTVYQISALGLAAGVRARSTSSSTRARASSSRRSSRGSPFASSRSRRRCARRRSSPGGPRRSTTASASPARRSPRAAHTAHGNASGTANLTGAGFKRGSAKAAAPGYVGASFRLP